MYRNGSVRRVTRHGEEADVAVERGDAGRETEFPCDHCGKMLSAPGFAAGLTGRCPVCRELVPVPIPVPIPLVRPARPKRRVLRVSSREIAAVTNAGIASQEVGGADAGDGLTTEIWIGWVSVVIAMVLILHAPRAAYAYLPFLVTGLLVGIRLLLGSRAFHGVVLLLCVCVSAPALAQRGLQWQPPWLRAPVAAVPVLREPARAAQIPDTAPPAKKDVAQAVDQPEPSR